MHEILIFVTHTHTHTHTHTQGGAITLSTLNITAIFRDMKIL